MDQETMKLTARYAIIVYVLYLTYMVTSIEYINEFDNKTSVLQVITGSVFAALTLIIKFHFDTKVDK